MSSLTGDVSLIQDEDVLRRMWQDSEDFGRKKEIRAHMYKLRESRLKDFYSSGDVSTDVQQQDTKTSSSSKIQSSSTTTSKSSSCKTHADSLADHSFISMKSKEVRDSESPTRDSYRVTDKSLALTSSSSPGVVEGGGWNVVSKNERSADGKTHTTSRFATTSGSEKIDGGKIDFAAKSEQKSMVFQDGDNENFTKSIGTASNSAITQQAVGGDENSSFKTSSTKTSSSSKVVSEYRSVSGDDTSSSHDQRIINDGRNDVQTSRQIYTSDAPPDVKSHPGYVEGKTKVIRETKTLPDGSRVTTTRYETKGESSSQQISGSNTSSDAHQSSTTTSNKKTSSSSKIVDEHRSVSRDDTSSHDKRIVSDGRNDIQTSRQIYTSDAPPDVKSHPGYVEGKTKVIRETKTLPDGSRVTTTRYETKGESSSQRISGSNTLNAVHQSSSTISSNRIDESNNRYVTESEPVLTGSTTTTKTITRHGYDSYQPEEIKVTRTSSPHIDTPIKTTVMKSSRVQDEPVTIVKKIVNEPIEISTSSATTKTTKVTKNVDVNDKTVVNENFINVERRDNIERDMSVKPREIEPRVDKPKESELTYEQPEKRQPYKPGKSEMNQNLEPTDGQYDTTYRAHYTKKPIDLNNKRISVDVSPTHEAFARSLRAVSPDRLSKSSTSSLRSSTSPDKFRHPSRFSPDRRSTSPKKAISNDTVTCNTDNYSTMNYRTTRTHDIDSSTLTRRSKTRKSPSSTTDVNDIEFVTDLDTNVTTKITKRPSSDLITVTRSRGSTSPEKKSPTRQLKRSDTYEERCKQILGITETTKRKGSIEKVTRRNSDKKLIDLRKSPTKEPQRKDSSPKIGEFPSQIRKSPEKEPLGPYPERKSPSKTSSKISEFSSQVKRSPQREPLGPYPEKRSPTKDGPNIAEFPSQIRRSSQKEPSGPYPERRRPSNDGSTICEFPSQIRRSPEREPLGSYPKKRRPSADGPSIGEFPSQIRRSPEREPSGSRPTKVGEFPSQIKQSPEKDVLGPYPEKKRPSEDRPTICEFPSQIRRSPEKEPLALYPHKKSPAKDGPKIGEFPSQIRRSPEREPLGPYPERSKPSVDGPTICEFPSQIRRSPEKEPLGPYPEKNSPSKDGPKITEFPSQIRSTPERERQAVKSRPYVEVPDRSPDLGKVTEICELPSPKRRTPDRQPLEILRPVIGTSTKLVKPKKSRTGKQGTTSSSSSCDEDDVEEIIVKTQVMETYENRIPVDEPLAIKRTISKLGPEDEILERSTKKNVFESETKSDHKTVKKDLSQTKRTDDFIKNERIDTNKKITTVIDYENDKPTSKKSTIGAKSTNKKVNTLYDVDNLSEEDNTIHIRTHRVDETIGKKVNGDVTRKVTGTTVKKTPDKITNNKITTRKDSNEVIKTTSTVTSPKRHVVTTTLTVTTGSPQKNTNKVSSTTNRTTLSKTGSTVTSKVVPTKGKKITKPKLQNGHNSDSSDSDNEDTVTSTTQKKITRTTSDQIIKNKVTSTRSPVNRGASKPELLPHKKPEKVMTTKSIIINNDRIKNEREVVVDLQRSKSSREPTPDRVCPLPVDYDDDGGTPRYPDDIIEPDDVLNRLINTKLVDLSIPEDDDEVTSRIVIDRVDQTDDSLLSVDKKIDKFTKSIDNKSNKIRSGVAPKMNRPNLDDVDDDLKSDECLLSVSQKVNKFITTAEQLTQPKDDNVDRPKSPKCRFYRDEDDRVTNVIDTAEEITKRRARSSLQIDESIENDSCLLSVSEKVDKFRKDQEPTLRRKISLEQLDIHPSSTDFERKSPPKTPKSQVRPNPVQSEEIRYARRDSSPKLPDTTPKSSTNRLRSTETVKRAKALFENKDTQSSILKQRDILSRPSIFGNRTNHKNQEELKSTRLIIDSTRTRTKSPEAIRSSREDSPSLIDDDDLPGYMRPLDRSLRPNSPHKESVNQTIKKSIHEIDSDVTSTKFGVTLKRTDSGRSAPTAAIPASIRKGSGLETTLTEEEIEKIFDWTYLEHLLEIVVSYDLRRKIRTQIRIVKKLISENKVRESSPQKTCKSEYQSSYNDRSKTSTTRRSQSPNTKAQTRKSPDKATFTSSQVKKSSASTTTSTQKVVVTSNEPEWVKQRNLRKVIDRLSPAKSIATRTTSSSSTTVKSRRVSPGKDLKPTDLITSSYGVGPTDENGSPLFGLRALRSKNESTTKVQGTTVRSQYYSKNGGEPVGSISMTKYSTDPRDLGRSVANTNAKGITSVTTTQKFGYKDTPSLRTLTTNKSNSRKAICDESSSKTSKFTRQGSVKAMSQKFIDNTVESLKNEKQTAYPKAGLILRTSSFKDDRSTSRSRESSQEKTTTTTVRTSRTSGSESFLTNRSKVTGIQDVISRMRTQDVREGDSIEDEEARGLLNKFLGAQVILSGIESSNVKASTSSLCDSSTKKSSTKVTTTIMEHGKEVTKTRIFNHPIGQDDLDSVWDEETLKLLLEQSTDYEERRRIRARLRQIMAEQEASAGLTDKSGGQRGQIGGTIDGESQLLPLLQGLLKAPDAEQTADSGTESGEDQRISLITEVQTALDKLSASLKSDSTDITEDRRQSLLQLVTKLQVGLATSGPSMERRSSGNSGGRFNRRRPRTNRHTVGVSSEELADARRLIEEISLSSSATNSLLKKQNSEGNVPKKPFKMYSPLKVKNAVAKPFSSSNSTVSGTSSSVQTPTESLDFLFNEDFDKKSISLDGSVKSPEIKAKMPTPVVTESETDDEITVKGQIQLHNQPDLVRMQTNPLYYQDESSIDRMNRFNSKKIKMKRANTIDIPKPLNFYEDYDSDSSMPEDDLNQRRRSNYLALRGPIRVGNGDAKNPPVFEAKTENDKKFLAFINKHQESTDRDERIDRKSSLWSKPNEEKGVWGNKFGNIKTAFEKASANERAPSLSTARQFWKTCDDTRVTKPFNYGPKISKESARNLQDMFKEKQRTGNHNKSSPWSDSNQNVVTGSLKVKTSQFDDLHKPAAVKYVPQPLPVNKFSHAPQSAFKPLPKKDQPLKKTIIHDRNHMDQPLFLYSPTKPDQSDAALNKPWLNHSRGCVTTSPGESRVLSLAHSKFEAVPSQSNDQIINSGRKLSKDKMNFGQNHFEKVTAPYLVRNVDDGSSVRKLSGQYDGSEGAPRGHDAYSTHTTVKYITSPKIDRKNYGNHGYIQPQQFSGPIQSNRPHLGHVPPPQPVRQYSGHVPPQSAQQLSGYGQAQRFSGPVHYQQPITSQQYYHNQYVDHNQRRQMYGQSRQVYSQPSESPYQQFPAGQAVGQQFNPSPQLSSPAQQLTPSPQLSSPSPRQIQSPAQNDSQYTSTYQFQPTTPLIEIQTAPAPPKLESQLSTESVHEHGAVSSRVMTGPVSQQAETVRQKSPMNRDQHDMSHALGLKNSLQKAVKAPAAEIMNQPIKVDAVISASNRFKPITSASNPRPAVSPGLSQSFTYSKNSSPGSFKYQEEVSNRSGVVSSKFHIPLIKTPKSEPSKADKVANKANSWNEICMAQQLGPPHKPSSRSSANARTVMKSKSSHSLAIPTKQYEAGMSRDEVAVKKRTMEAFFSGGAKSPLSRTTSQDTGPQEMTAGKVVKRSINRIKTADKTSASTYRTGSSIMTSSSNGGGLCRSRTLPDLVGPQMLDESNVDEAFEDLFKSNC